MEELKHTLTLQNTDGTFCLDLYPKTYIHSMMLTTRHQSKLMHLEEDEINEYLRGVIKVCKCALHYFNTSSKGVQKECKVT